LLYVARHPLRYMPMACSQCVLADPNKTRQKKGVSNHNTRQTFDVLKSSFGKRLVLNTALPSCPPHIWFIKRGRHMLFSKRFTTLGIAIAALLTPLASADALPPVRAGILQCQGGQNVGFVVGSVTSLECVFKSEGRRPEPYIATVRRYGLDLGVTAQTQLAWAVSAPNNRVNRGDLAGNYGGVGANASVGIGGGGNFLVGGPANSYALQPVSLQGQTGLNVAAGIADLQLEPFRGYGPSRRHGRRHHRR
jgi:hypothetical protein